MSSILKYLDDQDNDGSRGQLFWGRARKDRAPFRGHRPPLLRDEEYNRLAERVYDGYARVFKLWEPDDLKAYQEVLDRILNNYYRPIHRQHLPVPEHNSFVVLLEWGVPRMEIDPRRVASLLGE